jgi:hypothetical protein
VRPSEASPRTAIQLVPAGTGSQPPGSDVTWYAAAKLPSQVLAPSALGAGAPG